MSEENSGANKPSFWTTLPGIITTITGLIVAITGLMQVLPSKDAQSNLDPTATLAPIVVTDTPEADPTTAPTVTETEEVITPTVPATEEPTEVAEVTPTVKHVSIPEEPDKNPTWFEDHSSLIYANLGYATADDFYSHPLERPFTAESMDYVGYTDIKRVEISTLKNFVYVSIGVEMAPPAGEMVYYGVEVDSDMDGRGDWLIYVQPPADSEWTVEGVRVFFDGDNSVGGPQVIESNPGIPGNGYEVLLFDAGYETTDPDMAWVRLSPGRSNYIEIAFKLSMIENVKRFLWSAWADAGPMNPGWFDYNDHFTLEEAGSPIQGANDYPLKDLAQVDSTCRFPFGFNARGDEPGVCN